MAIGKHDVHSETYQNLYYNIITLKRPPFFLTLKTIEVVTHNKIIGFPFV